MTRGIDRYDDKKRREVRRRNHIAKDLHESKYRQRVRNRETRYIPKVEEFNDGE